jgi:hypothetical protein
MLMTVVAPGRQHSIWIEPHVTLSQGPKHPWCEALRQN